MALLSSYPDRTLTRVLGHDAGNLVGKSLVREALTADRFYWVSSTGSNSNPGTFASPFLTIQYAYSIARTLDFNGFDCYIYVNDGTYTAGLNLASPWVGGGILRVIGNSTTPANVLISTTSADCFVTNGVLSGDIYFGGFKFQTSGASGSAVAHRAVGTMFQQYACEYGACVNYHASVINYGAVLALYGPRTISGDASANLLANTGGLLNADAFGTQTLVGSRTISTFAVATRGGVIVSTGANYVGTAPTGARYSVDTGGIIYSGGGGPNYFPGTTAGSGGTTSGGGYYV